MQDYKEDEDDEDGTTKEEEITDAIDVAAGANHTLILRKDGTVWATGYNNKGQFPLILLLDENGVVLKKWEEYPEETVQEFIEKLKS